MKKNQVPKTRMTVATIQPIHTNVRTARSMLRSEGLRIPNYLPGLDELSRSATGCRSAQATSHTPPMARETQTIDVHALGTVTFRPLGKVQIERVQAQARRTSVSPFHDKGSKASPQEIEDALLVSKQVIEPKFSSNEEFFAALQGHHHVLGDIADAIRAASWPNQSAG